MPISIVFVLLLKYLTRQPRIIVFNSQAAFRSCFTVRLNQGNQGWPFFSFFPCRVWQGNVHSKKGNLCVLIGLECLAPFSLAWDPEKVWKLFLFNLIIIQSTLVGMEDTTNEDKFYQFGFWGRERDLVLYFFFLFDIGARNSF